MPQTAIHNSTEPSESLPEKRLPPRPSHRPRHALKKRVRLEVGAGGIIYRVRNGEPEFFFVRHGKGHWTFPKGHQDLGETLVQTAIREIKEEAGLVGLRFVAPIGKTSFRFQREGVTIEKTVQFYLFEAPSDAQEVLTGEEAIWEATWVPSTEAPKTCGYRNLRALLEKSIELLKHKRRERRSW